MSKYLSIDLDSQGIFVVAGTARAGSAKVEQAVAWAGTEAEGGPPPLTGETAQRIGEELRDRLRTAGMPHAPVIVTVGRERVVLKELRYPAVAPHEEPNIVKFQALKELSDSPDDVVLDYVPLTNGAGTGERRSMAVAVRKELYSAIQKMCAAANLKLAAVTPRPYAIASGIGQAFATGAAPAPDSAAEAVAVLTLGPGGGEFTVVRNGEVTFTLAVPGPVMASETMLLAQIRRHLTTYAGSNPGHPVQALYVADADDSWGLRLRPALGIPVYAFDPLGEAVRDIPEELRGRFAGAAGLLAARGGTLPINFTTPRQPRAEGDPKKNQILLAALVALLLVIVGGGGGWWVLTAAEEKTRRLMMERDQLKAQVDREAINLKRVEAADHFLKRRVVWLDEIYDMSLRVNGTGDVHASLFHGKEVPPGTGAKTGRNVKTAAKSAVPAHQATLQLKVATRNGFLIDSLLNAIDRDNPGNDPKSKYYDEFVKNTHPTPPTHDKEAVEATITTTVKGRPPETYTRPAPAGFEPPPRKDYPPPPGATREAKPKNPGAKAAQPTSQVARTPVAPAPKTRNPAE